MSFPSNNIWLLIGAGISAGAPSNLPLWGEIARDTMQYLYKNLEYKISESGGDGFRLAKESLDELIKDIYPEVILESLCTAYGKTEVINQLYSLLKPSDCQPNACHHAIAQLCKQGQVRGIITTNFDTLIEDALDIKSIDYHVITTNNLKNDESIPIIKAHGTITDSLSLAFTRSEYYLGIHQDLLETLLSNMMGTTLVIAGYSGNDIDIFPFLQSLIEKNTFEKVHVVDLVPRNENKRFGEIINQVEYHNEAAEYFLGRLANMPIPLELPIRKRIMSAIVPNRAKFPATIFFGDCLLQLGHKSDLAFRIFFLSQDIAEETGDLRHLCISLFAKSRALFNIGDNSWGEMEYSAGRNMLHSILENSTLFKYKEIFREFGRSLASLEIDSNTKRSFGSMSGTRMPKGHDQFDNTNSDIELLHNVLRWELLTRIRVCFSALAAATKTDRTEEKHKLLAVAEKLMIGFEKWESYFADSKRADELAIIPLFYAKFFRAYKSIVLKEDNRWLQSLAECISLSKHRGFYIGTSQCYFLMDAYGISLSEIEIEDYKSIQKYCGVNLQKMIAPLFFKNSEPFDLTINTYKPLTED